MKTIQLWSVSESEKGQLKALGLDEKESVETEDRLEELLVSSPDLLLDGLSLVARQLPTDSGFPDLVGVDQEGRLVLLELKRGTLTRDAVAQVLDYGSDLAGRELDDLARSIQEHSGRRGIEKLDDFLDWHSREYPNDPDALAQKPRLILVGLGVDERAKRIVNFLADAGVDIQLLTFHAFDLDGRLLLAKQVETVPPTTGGTKGGGTSKDENRAMLLALAEQQEVKDLLVEVADFIEDLMPCYRWPGKTAFSFSLQEKTQKGNPTLRSYITLWVHRKKRGTLFVTLPTRALDVAADAVGEFVVHVPNAKRQESSWAPVEAEITSTSWPNVRPHLEELLLGLVAGWKERSVEAEAEEVNQRGHSDER